MKRKTKYRICITPHCRRNAVKHRKLCHTCISRRYRTANPMRYAFKTLRDNAKRRGHEFQLTFEQFAKFAIRTKYLAGKGRTKDSFSIDRRENWRGYVLDNIRILTVGANSRKKKLDYDWETKQAVVVEIGGGNWAILKQAIRSDR